MMEGMGHRASVKQIMHMSSASCRRPLEAADEHPCKQGKQLVSLRIPPQKWPQSRTLTHANLEFSTQSLSEQRLSITGWSGVLCRRQNRQVLKLPPIPGCGRTLEAFWREDDPSRNSTIAFKVSESAKASSQKSLVRPQPS